VIHVSDSAEESEDGLKMVFGDRFDDLKEKSDLLGDIEQSSDR
jgi:hypothetical protein